MGIKLTYNQKIAIAILLTGIIVFVIWWLKTNKKFTQLKLRASPLLKATSSSSCLFTADQTTVKGIQTQIATIQTAVNALNPAPTSDVLSTFNTTIASVNSQITNLLALPICCSGLNQEYNSTTNKCQCKSPYGLDSNTACSISCTSPQAVWTGGVCGCNTGYTILADYTTCDNPSNDKITGTYIPQLTQFVTTLNSLTKNIPLPSLPLIGAYGGYTFNVVSGATTTGINGLPVTNGSYLAKTLLSGLIPTVSTTSITIPQGQGLKSPDGSHIFVMQANGEAAVFNTSNGNKTWNSGTAGKGTPPYSIVWGANGSLSVNDSTGTTYWTTGGAFTPLPEYLVMQNDGNVVLYTITGSALWYTSTSGT